MSVARTGDRRICPTPQPSDRGDIGSTGGRIRLSPIFAAGYYLRELIGQVVSSLLRNKLRSFLTMAGIAWGVASIVLIVAMGDGFKQGQRNNTKQLGESIVLIFPGRTEKQAGGQRAGRRIRFSYDDIRDIRTECYLVNRVIGELQNGAKASSPFNS